MSGPVGGKSDAEKAFEAYINGTEPESDTMRRVARAFLLLAVALSKLAEGQTAKVANIADELGVFNDHMKMLNQKVSEVATLTDNDSVLLIRGTQQEVQDFRTKLLAAADFPYQDTTLYYIVDEGNGVYSWSLKKGECNTAIKNMQMSVDDLSSLSQQEQLALQTIMTRFNTSLEGSATATQKAGTQAQTALRGMTA